MKCIAWEFSDGSVAITVPVEPRGQHESDETYLDRIAAKCKADGVVPQAAIRRGNIDSTTLPSRVFRGAWRWKATSVEIDLTAAKAIKKGFFRSERNKRLSEADSKSIQDAVHARYEGAIAELSGITSIGDLERMEINWE